MMTEKCPCQSGLIYSDCCEPYIAYKIKPDTAQALMRSRYTAYVQADWKYIFKTWHKTTRPTLPSLRSSGHAEWLGLNVVGCSKGLLHDEQGHVEFVATYKRNKNEKGDEAVAQIKERSKFVCEKGQWLYLDATT